MFESLGVTERTLAVYRGLLQRPALMHLSEQERMAELATQVGCAEAEVRSEVELLHQLGLIVPRWNIADEDYPLDPAVGFERLAALQRQKIDELAEGLRQDELAASGFTAAYREFLVRRTARDVELLEGAEAAYQRLQHMQPQVISWAMIPPNNGGSRKNEDSPDRGFLERGVESRYLLAESEIKHRDIREYCQWVIGFGAKVRTVPSVPMKLLILDDAAVLGIDPKDTSAGAVIHHSVAVVNLAKEFYESYWRRADDPFADDQPGVEEITAQEAELLQLLVQGATDEQAGRKLGVSLRTVRRMAAKLSEQAGASGRFELGVRAAQRGWVR